MTGKVLVAGVSGVVGYAAAQHFAQLPGWEVVGVARRPPADLMGADLRAVDLTDPSRCREVFSTLEDVTHVVYAALFEKPGLLPGWRERDQMETNLAMFRNLMDPLVGAASGLEHVSLLQGTKAYGAHVEPMAVPGRERNPRHEHENFYWLQEDDLRQRHAGSRWAWTIMRPQVIYGESLGSNMNPIPALGTYAAVQRLAGEPLSFPGGVPMLGEAVDADLLAHALAWAAVTPVCRNETYNITNGDVYSLRNVWPVVADAFGMEVGPDRPHSLAAEMPGRQGQWEEVVRRFGLRSPVSLEAFVGQSFIYADLVSGFGLAQSPSPALLSTIKARQHGFQECMDTEDMFRKWIGHFQAKGLFPPRDW